MKPMKSKRPFRYKSKKVNAPKKLVLPSIPKTPWELALEGKDVINAKTYSMKTRFAAHEAMRHAVFGLGVVTALLAENKIEVLFQSGYKVLIQA